MTPPASPTRPAASNGHRRESEGLTSVFANPWALLAAPPAFAHGLP